MGIDCPWLLLPPTAGTSFLSKRAVGTQKFHSNLEADTTLTLSSSSNNGASACFQVSVLNYHSVLSLELLSCILCFTLRLDKPA